MRRHRYGAEMEPTRKQKRVVSRTALLFMKLRLCSLLISFGIATVGLGIITAASCLFAFYLAVYERTFGFWFAFMLFSIGSGIVAYHTGVWAKIQHHELGDLKSLYTVNSTLDLPAHDSLVRASEKPEQARTDMLLRAAADGQPTPPDQLLRSSLETKN